MSQFFDQSSLSDRGGREVNEDSCGFSEVGGVTCWVVADGLGGHKFGKMASELAVETVLDAFRRSPQVHPNAIRSYIEAAHASVQAKQTDSSARDQMGTTLVIFVADRERAVWGHVGDSRIYHLRGGKVVFQTRDHSLQHARTGLRASGQTKDADRGSLLQAVGLPGPILPAVVDEPLVLAADDAFILCVDGFWEQVSEAEMEVDFAKASSSDAWIKSMALRLRGRVQDGDDNYTAVVIRAMAASSPLVPPIPGRFSPFRLGLAATALLAVTVLATLLVRLRPLPVPAGPGAVHAPVPSPMPKVAVWPYPAVLVAKGSFSMGVNPSPPKAGQHGKKGAPSVMPDTAPKHQVTFSHDLCFGVYEVSQRDWQTVRGGTSNPASFSECVDCPVESVSWLDAVQFANAASDRDGLTACYELRGTCADQGDSCVRSVPNCNGFRLPTEAEWEYVASKEIPAKGAELEKLGWVKSNSEGKTHPVGKKPPSNGGFHDLAGNVAEWVWDIYGPSYQQSPSTDPAGPGRGSRRGLRGCSFEANPENCEAVRRRAASPEKRFSYLGFRLVRSIPDGDSSCALPPPRQSSAIK